MRTLLKVLGFMVVSAIVTRVVALFVARQSDEGTEVSDEFRRTVVFDGIGFTSRAGGLRRGEVSVLMGSARVDLRNAVLDPGGAHLAVETTMGGLSVHVRDDWAVIVEETLIGGGQTEVQVTSPDDLPADAPRLTIDVTTRLASTLITTGDDW
mgnify:FL=1